ncbi:hypothetical protein BVY01_00670 [bacterium I07]|nr:hypothetical protein BVY01_00670 [bacterium I07]
MRLKCLFILGLYSLFILLLNCSNSADNFTLHPDYIQIDQNRNIQFIGDMDFLKPLGVFDSVLLPKSKNEKGEYILILNDAFLNKAFIYRINRDEYDVEAVLAGNIVHYFVDGQVKVDIRNTNVNKIYFRIGTEPKKKKEFWAGTLFGYRPFVLAKWCYDDSTIQKWHGLGFVVFLVRLFGSLILLIIDVILTLIFGVGQILYHLFGVTARNIGIGILFLIILIPTIFYIYEEYF